MPNRGEAEDSRVRKGGWAGGKGEDWLQEQEGQLSGRGPGTLERRPGRRWNRVPRGGPWKSAEVQGSWARVAADCVGDEWGPDEGAGSLGAA